MRAFVTRDGRLGDEVAMARGRRITSVRPGLSRTQDRTCGGAVPTITLNGRTVEASEGQTILGLARANGVYVPSLCYHPETGQTAACRVCAVEVEGARGLVTACNTAVRAAMVIRTDTDQVQEARRLIVDLLLSDGSHDCLSCEMCGRCELQDVAYHLGIERPSEPRAVPPLPLDQSHPMIARDPN